MKKRNASFSAFGWDFQINAAIVLMLENITEVNKVRVEGSSEDIELTLDSGEKIYSQAKSVVKASNDFTNVKQKLNDALESLADAYKMGDSKQLIYVTNSPNPFNDDSSKSAFYGSTKKSYDSLPDSCKCTIQSMTEQLSESIDLNQLVVRVIPFETDDLTERYKEVKRVVDDFVYEIAPNYLGIGKQVLDIWQKDLFQNATQRNVELTISKKQLVWTIIVLTTDIEKNESEYLDDIDCCDYQEIVCSYRNLINTCTERFEFATKVITDYNEYFYEGKARDKLSSFINGEWQNYMDEIDMNGIDDDIKEQIIKIILYNILKQKRIVNSIKKKVNL